MNTKTYLDNFFAEKVINYTEFEIVGRDGQTHFLDTDVVIESIMNCGDVEQGKIAEVLRKIDFCNGSVSHFLAHLAEGLVMNY